DAPTEEADGVDYPADTTATIAGDTATYVSQVPDFGDLTITSTITVTPENTVVFEMTDLAGADAARVDEISIPNHSPLPVTSSEAGASLARTKISTDATTTADQFIDLTAGTPLDASAVGTPYAFVGNGDLSAGILTNATDDSDRGNNDNWNHRLLSQIVD